MTVLLEVSHTLMYNNCDSTAGGKSCCDVHMTVLLEVSHAVMYTQGRADDFSLGGQD